MNPDISLQGALFFMLRDKDSFDREQAANMLGDLSAWIRSGGAIPDVVKAVNSALVDVEMVDTEKMKPVVCEILYFPTK